jgi:nucleotide-binding universal stress UspA family protein
MKDWDIKTIVLGYDGSEGADEAVCLASTLARQHNARIFVVTAFQGVHIDGLGEQASREIAAAQVTARELVFKLRAAGIEAEPEALEGPAGDALLRVAETRGADLVVIGRRGHGLVAGLLLGSTSEHVVRRAKVPVLVAH